MKHLCIPLVLTIMLGISEQKNVFQLAQDYQQQNLTEKIDKIRRNGPEDKISIMLYGDSITDGTGSSDTKTWKYSWANLLNVALQSIDTSFAVVEQGKGERCVSQSCAFHCSNDTQCQQALKKNVSSVILTIGSYDARDKTWNEDDFKRDYVNLCYKFRNMTSRPDVFIAIPPPMYKDGYAQINQTIVNSQISKMIPKLANECGVPETQVIDLFETMGGQFLQGPQYFCDEMQCDGFHPVDAGQNLIAQTVMSKIMDFYLNHPNGRLASEGAQQRLAVEFSHRNEKFRQIYTQITSQPFY